MFTLNVLIAAEIERLIYNRTNFSKPELLKAIERSPRVAAELRRLTKAREGVDFRNLVERGLIERINRYLRKSDRYGFRIYESCKPDGSAAWLWFKMSVVTEDQLLLIIQNLRVRERGLRLKRERYQIFADRMGQMKKGTTLGEIYEDVAPIAARYTTK